MASLAFPFSYSVDKGRILVIYFLIICVVILAATAIYIFSRGKSYYSSFCSNLQHQCRQIILLVIQGYITIYITSSGESYSPSSYNLTLRQLQQSTLYNLHTVIVVHNPLITFLVNSLSIILFLFPVYPRVQIPSLKLFAPVLPSHLLQHRSTAPMTICPCCIFNQMKMSASGAKRISLD